MNNVANFFDSKEGDRKYTAEDFRNWLKGFLTNGVVANQLFAQAGEGMTITVSPGFAFINGYWKRFDETELEVQPASAGATNERIDAVVVELDTENEDMTIKIETNQQTPVRTGSIYQLIIAKIYVPAAATTSAYALSQSKIKDTRMDEDLCGYIARFMSAYSFEDEIAAYDAFVESMISGKFGEFDSWFEAAQSIFTPTVATDLQNLISTLNARITTAGNKLTTETNEIIALDNRAKAIIPFTKNTFTWFKLPSASEVADIYGADDADTYNIIASLEGIDWDKVVAIIGKVKMNGSYSGIGYGDILLTRHDYGNGNFSLRGYGQIHGIQSYSRTIASVNSTAPTTANKSSCYLGGAYFELVRTQISGKPDALSAIVREDVKLDGSVSSSILNFNYAHTRDVTANGFRPSYTPYYVTNNKKYWRKVYDSVFSTYSIEEINDSIMLDGSMIIITKN